MSEESNRITEDLLIRVHSGGQEHPAFGILQNVYKIFGVSSPKECLAEIRWAGSHSLFYPFRKEGVDYDEVVKDACCNIASNISLTSADFKDKNLEEMESRLIEGVTKTHFDKLSEEERAQIAKQMERVGALDTNSELYKFLLSVGAGSSTTAGIHGIAAVLAAPKTLMATFLSIFGVRSRPKTSAFLLPFLGIAFGASCVIGFMGPAYKKTVPAVHGIAMMRLLDKASG